MAAKFPLLAKRVYTSKQMSRTCPIQPSSGSMFRPMKYKAWTEEQMSLAHQALLINSVSAELQKSMEFR